MGGKEHSRTVATAAKVFSDSADKQSAGYQNGIWIPRSTGPKTPTQLHIESQLERL